VETTFSVVKRNFGETLRARKFWKLMDKNVSGYSVQINGDPLFQMISTEPDYFS
jgi:hypothetical protein